MSPTTQQLTTDEPAMPSSPNLGSAPLNPGHVATCNPPIEVVEVPVVSKSESAPLHAGPSASIDALPAYYLRMDGNFKLQKKPRGGSLSKGEPFVPVSYAQYDISPRILTTYDICCQYVRSLIIGDSANSDDRPVQDASSFPSVDSEVQEGDEYDDLPDLQPLENSDDEDE
ncbi:hypothetical protein B0H11DRAFT_2239733 [Mycena galericulata]|nr:hypothetical protein B0H11DRAFT_2239733 [Mycena galericulata]